MLAERKGANRVHIPPLAVSCVVRKTTLPLEFGGTLFANLTPHSRFPSPRWRKSRCLFPVKSDYVGNRFAMKSGLWQIGGFDTVSGKDSFFFHFVIFLLRYFLFYIFIYINITKWHVITIYVDTILHYKLIHFWINELVYLVGFTPYTSLFINILILLKCTFLLLFPHIIHIYLISLILIEFCKMMNYIIHFI